MVLKHITFYKIILTIYQTVFIETFKKSLKFETQSLTNQQEKHANRDKTMEDKFIFSQDLKIHNFVERYWGLIIKRS